MYLMRFICQQNTLSEYFSPALPVSKLDHDKIPKNNPSWTTAIPSVVTVGLAATVPWLELLVSLLGAVKMSTLSLMAPALIGR
jgi:hypothetical protein